MYIQSGWFWIFSIFFFPHQEAERKHLPPTAVTVDTPKRGRAANTGQIHRVILRFPSLLFNISATCSLILSEDQRHGLTCVLLMPLLRVCVFYNVMSPTGERINHIFSGKLFPFNYINVPWPKQLLCVNKKQAVDSNFTEVLKLQQASIINCFTAVGLPTRP